MFSIELPRQHKKSMLILALTSLLIFGLYQYYNSKISSIAIIPDEYGYLLNASYLAGKEWGHFSGLYYNFGYSLLLVPFFWLGWNGAEIIQAAVTINSVCVILTYWCAISLLRKVYPKVPFMYISLVSAIFSLYPCTVSYSIRVFGETELMLCMWVSGLMLYNALEKGKKRWYFALGIVLSYMYMIHIRTIFFVLVTTAVLAGLLWKRRIDKGEFFIFVATLLAMFVLAWSVKKVLINELYYVGGQSVGNTISLELILQKVYEFGRNLPIYICNFLCKCFYLLVASSGMVFVGIKECVVLKKEKNEGAIVFITYLLSGMIMLLAVTAYWTQDGVTGYAYMGRYYEGLFTPIMMLGLMYCITGDEKKKWKTLLCAGIIGILIWMLTYCTAGIMTPNGFDMTGMDSASLWYALYQRGMTEDYRGMILLTGGIALVTFIAIAVMSMTKLCKYMIPVIIACTFVLNDMTIINKVIAQNHTEEQEILQEISRMTYNGTAENKVYCFTTLDSTDMILQALIGNKELVIADEKHIQQLKDGDYVIACWDSPILGVLDEDLVMLAEWDAIGVYRYNR